MTGKVVLITGGNRGIGLETGKGLAKLGATVILAAREIEKGEDAKEVVERVAKKEGLVEFVRLDLGSIKSIEEFVRDLKARDVKIDVLVNNAGIISGGKVNRTVDGFPMAFGVNHLGHFLLTVLLLNQNLFNEKEGNECRIVTVASTAFKTVKTIDFDPQRIESLSIFDRYAQSKLANVLFSMELHNKLKERGRNISTASLHPGYLKSGAAAMGDLYGTAFYYLSKLGLMVIGVDLEDSAQTTLYCVLNPNLKSGKFYQNCEEEPTNLNNSYEDLAKKLWVESEKLVNHKLK